MVSAVLPSGLQSMGESTFCDTYRLESVVIPEGVTEIPNQTFHGSSALKTVVIAGSVQRIGQDAFSGLKNGASDTTIIFQGRTPPEIDSKVFGSIDGSGAQPEGLTVIVPAGAEAAYTREGFILREYILQEDGCGRSKTGYFLFPINA